MLSPLQARIESLFSGEHAIDTDGVIHTSSPRTIYDGLQPSISELTASVNDEPSLTKQCFKEECSIDFILERFAATGELSENRGIPKYGDFSQYQQGDYLHAMTFVNSARDAFMELPADARKQFDNDPGVFLDWIVDPANSEKAISLGLATKAMEGVAERAHDAGVAKPSSPAGGNESAPVGAV